jgi:hypothetical protein
MMISTRKKFLKGFKFRPGQSMDLGGIPDELRFLVGQAAISVSRTSYSTFKHLWDSEVRVFSQWGEDGILCYLSDELDLVRPTVLEFGAGNFSECNSRYLAEARNASVVAVDSRHDLLSNVLSLPISWKTSVWPIRTWITPDNAPQIMQQAREKMGRVDILSLDIDGNDFWVAKSLDLSSIRIVVVEYNAIFGSKQSITVQRRDNFDRTSAHHSNLYYGASLKAFIHLFQDQGFTFIGTNRACSNAFFVQEAELSNLSLQRVDLQELDKYIDVRFRESRDSGGSLSYAGRNDLIKLIEHLPVEDTISQAVNLLKNLDL